jgi:hypothetical protein
MPVSSERASRSHSGFDQAVFLNDLEALYIHIVHHSQGLSCQNIRRRCDRLFAEAFEQVGCRVQGIENLPRKPGQIFIVNHHKVNPVYTLRNQFQITLDTHYISTLLSSRYPVATAVRVVREGRTTETAHTDYFDRFGYLYVKTSESDVGSETEAEKRDRRNRFFSAASRVIRSGANLILCPEGTSYLCEDSPGPFKPGPFLLAGSIRPEPWIVPIAIANFDKLFHEHRPALVINKPFRISERVAVDDREGLNDFLREFREEYRGYIRQARALADQRDPEVVQV